MADVHSTVGSSIMSVDKKGLKVSENKEINEAVEEVLQCFERSTVNIICDYIPIYLPVGITYEEKIISEITEGFTLDIARIVFDYAYQNNKYYYSSEVVQLLTDVYDYTQRHSRDERQFLRTVRHVRHFEYMRSGLHTERVMESFGFF